MKKFTSLIAILLLVFGTFCPAFSQGKNKVRIAVLDFNNSGGLSEQETVTLTNRLNSMLVQSNVFTVLERGKMQEILEEQGFQQSGCTSTECAVEMGQLLNVQKMVSGSIGKIGDTYTIDLSLLDVQTAKIDQSFFRDYKGEIDGLLEIMQLIASQIAHSGSVKLKNPAQVVIESDPQGARILFNGSYIGTTPFTTEAEMGMELTIWLQKTNYKDWQKKIVVDDNMEIEAELESVSGKSDGMSSAWYWIGGGAVLVGGAAAFLLSGDSGNSAGSNDYPKPPSRP